MYQVVCQLRDGSTKDNNDKKRTMELIMMEVMMRIMIMKMKKLMETMMI